jgi:hypothetical protein
MLRVFETQEERQMLNGTHHSLFGNTGPLFGDTFPESALAPAAGAALGRPPPGTSGTGSSSAAELREMRRQLDDLHAQDPDEAAVRRTKPPSFFLRWFLRVCPEPVWVHEFDVFVQNAISYNDWDDDVFMMTIESTRRFVSVKAHNWHDHGWNSDRVMLLVA